METQLLLILTWDLNVVLSESKRKIVGWQIPAESRTSDKIEKVFGLASKDYTKAFVENCKKEVIIRT
jgi:hypothetical protein